MRWLAVGVGLLSLVLPPTAALAQASFELTPYVGYQFGADFVVEDFEFGRARFDLDDGSTRGLSFDIPLNPSFQVELLYLEASTELRLDDSLFLPPLPLADIDLTFFHAGVLWQLARGQVRPFAVLTGGVTRFSPDFPDTGSAYRLSLALGGGVKVLFNRHLGLRLEGRAFFTDIDTGDRGRRCCHTDDNAIVQAHAAAGLIIAF